MTLYRVPVFVDVPFYTYTAQLEGKSYRFSFSFNSRAQTYYFDLADEDDVRIFCGVRLVNDYPIAGRFRDLRKPPGLFALISLESDNSDAALADLGRRVRFLYFDSDDLPEAEAVSLDLVVEPSP